MLYADACIPAVPLQEAQLSLRDPCNAQYQLKYWPTVVWMKTDRVSAREALSATSTFYSVTYIVLYTHRCTMHNYCASSMYIKSCWRQLDHICDQPTSTTTSVVDDTAYYSTSAPSWMQTTMVNGHKLSAIRRLSFKQQKWPWRSFSRSSVMVPFNIVQSHVTSLNSGKQVIISQKGVQIEDRDIVAMEY